MSDEIKILAVDDDDPTLIILRKILESAHYVADTANSVQEAFGKLKENRYDAILCDIWMPDMDGKAFYEYVGKNFPGTQQIVIFMTADVASSFTWDFIDGQNLPYVLKPFNRNMLVEQLTKVIGRGPIVDQHQPVQLKPGVWNGKNRRNYRRISTKSKVKIEAKNPRGGTEIGTMVDAHLKGASFLSAREYAVGAELKISYPYPDVSSFAQTGTVVSAERLENGLWRIAVAL
jgi:CheY-like chemotaxis protein